MEKGYEWIVSLQALCLIGFLGMLMNFFKLKIKGETLTDIGSYFNEHFKSTIIALVSTLITVVAYYFTLSTGQYADILTVFSLGYMCDSAFNKFDKQLQA